MNAANAPLYVRAHDLAAAVAAHPGDGTTVGRLACEAAAELLVAVSLALTFPGERAADLRTADRAVVRVRVLLRVAAERGLLTPGALRARTDALAELGRMLGGWQRTQRRRQRGDGLHGAPPA
jgi:hypothetical protein